MAKNKFYFLVISLTLVFTGCKSQSIENVTGKYVNSNFDYEPFIAELPYLIDTLILNKDYSFKSGYYGEGIFELKENKIKLIYNYEFGSSSFEAPIETDSDGNPKIILFKEHNHHYRKIK